MGKNSKIRIKTRRQGALDRLLAIAEPTKRALAEIATLQSRLGR